jgi:ribonucleoside-triphosphate reductase
MIRKIRKRDGKITDFNPIQITNAIWKAAQAVGGKDYKKSIELTDRVLERLEKELKKGEIPTVEQVQDLVEKTLIEEGHARTGKAYILYRKQHQDMREIGGLLKDIDVVDDYLSMMDWKVQENSNMSYSLQGLNVYATENIISHYWLNKIYPPEIGDAHKQGSYHIHDLGTLGAYTYYGKETIIAKKDGKIIITSFQDLYKKLNDPEQTLSKKDEATAKYPKNIEVLDKDGWTKIYRVVKKAKQKNMHYIKNEGGRSVIVTEDHPMLTGNGEEKQAKHVQKENDTLLTVDLQKLLQNEKLFYKKHLYLAKELYDRGVKNFWIEGMPLIDYKEYSNNLEINGIISTSNNAESLPNKIELTEKLGYLIGFYIAEGTMGPHRISIIQKNIPENQTIIDKLTEAAYQLGCRIYTKTKNDLLELRIVNTTLVRYLLTAVFNLEGRSQEKRLPDEILTYNQDFIRGIIAGIIDGDGSINTSKTTLAIRTASRTMLEQTAQVMNILGFTARDRNLQGVGTTRIYNGREITQNYPLYGISFRTLTNTLPSQLYQTAQMSTKAWRAEGPGWHKVLNNEPTQIMDDYIYDITTETSTLIVNGMWNHNCVGWDLKDILLLGFKGVSGKIESKPAKHFSTALMQIVNYLYTLQGEAAGAQALSNFDSLLAPFIKYDGLKYKDVKQEMQKFLFNMNVPTRVGFQSLAHDEPIIFKENGKIKIEQIGKLIEENFGQNRKKIINNIDGYGNPSKDSFAMIPDNKYEVISFNKKGGIQWRPVKALIKHRILTNGFKKIRTGSGEIKVSPAHSLFRSNSSHIKPVMAKELECAKPNSTLNGKNHILAVNKLKQNMLGDKKQIDLFDLIEELPEKIKKRIFIKAKDVPRIKEKISKLYGSLKEFLYKDGRTDKTTLYKGFKNNVVSFETYIKYSDEIRKDAKIYIKPYNESLYDRYLDGEKLQSFVELTAWFITEGKAVHSGIVVSQRKNNSKQILDVAKSLGIKVNISETHGYSNKNQRETKTIISNMKMSGLYTYLLPYLAGATSKEKTVPSYVFDLNSEYRNIFLETLFKGDGYIDKKSKRITYSSMSDKLLTGISMLGIVNGWRIRVVPKNKDRAGTLLIYKNPRKKLDITIEETAGVPVYEINDYKNGWDWEYDISVDINDCEENFVGGAGLVFYHNSPFTNITMDLTVPSYMKDEPAIIGGELKDDNYSDFLDEMDMINHAFADIMEEGDAKGRPFTFPIPTYNITKDFKWDNDGLNPIWEMTAKYGVPYFSNFVNSDMKPDDARSMCPLAGDEKVLIKSSRGRGVEYSTIRNIYEGNSHQDEYEIYSDGRFIKGKFNKWDNQRMLKIILENGHEIKMSAYHLNYILNNQNDTAESVLKAQELKPGMYLPYSLNEYGGEGGTKEMGYFVGAYAGDGSLDGDTSVVFSLENIYKKGVIKKLESIAKDFFGAHSTITTYEGTKLTTLKIHSKAAVGLVKDYIEGKQRNKHYKARIFTTGKEFRKGVIEGHYDTDGGNRNRIYTSSPKMIETLNMLAATLGTTTSIYKDDREGRLGKEPNYAVLIYQLNRQKYGETWFKKNNKLWVRIKEIKPVQNSSAYCFEVNNGTPVFTVGTTGILTHNCRLRLDNRELRKRGGGLFGANPKTGSIGVVTINMPQIGYLARDEDDFFERLDALMELAKQSLGIKREIIENLTFSGLHPYSRFYLGDIKKTFGEYWKNHFSTIGLIGLNDALLNFMNKSIGDKEGKQFAEKVLDHMREKMADFQVETGDIFNLESTPGEGTSYRLARIDKAQYPDIRVYNQERYNGGNGGRGLEPYYTNSSQLPVGFTDDVFEALDLQDSLQSKYTGGTVLHMFLGEQPSATATKKLVRKVAENYHLPYYTLTPTFSICPKHGYIPGEHRFCPKCDEEIGYKKKTKVVVKR